MQCYKIRTNWWCYLYHTKRQVCKRLLSVGFTFMNSCSPKKNINNTFMNSRCATNKVLRLQSQVQSLSDTVLVNSEDTISSRLFTTQLD